MPPDDTTDDDDYNDNPNQYLDHHGHRQCSDESDNDSCESERQILNQLSNTDDEAEDFESPENYSGCFFNHCLRKTLTHMCSNFGLFCAVVLYVLLGAFIFESLEAETELEQTNFIQKSREECLKELWVITGKKFQVFSSTEIDSGGY